ncbi:hypothetical protein [Actinocorallia libanotica]|uniref:Phage-related protein n=1 Tax=Actinocorallia libanotica TaxID=46162 RepID=A0ABN1RY85_9ACTN
MAPSGQTVGRISIKVLPDTSDFREEAQKELNKIERVLEATVQTTADMFGATKELLEGIREINAKNKTMASRKIRIYTTISTAGKDAMIRDAVRDLQNSAQSNGLRLRLSDVEVTGDVNLKVDPASLDKAKKDLEDWRDDISPLTVGVMVEMVNGAGAAVSARLSVLTRPRTVNIIPRLNNAAAAKVATALAALSGARVLHQTFERLGNVLRNLDKTVPIIGTLTLAIAGLAGWALTAASNLFALSSSLAQIGPLALLLPGLLGGMAVGLGATIVALADFNKVLPQVKTQLSQLRTIISDNFWEKAKGPIGELVDGLLPKFSQGLAKVSTEAGAFFGAFATSLKGALDPLLAQMFTDLSESIKVATQGTDAFAGIIATFGKVGTSYLPRLAQWFVDISERFDAFLSQADADGRLEQWIETGLANLKELGSVIANLGGIFAGLARAAEAAGGSSLGHMADTLERLHAVVDSPSFQAGLTDVLAAAHQSMNNIATQSGPAVENFFKVFGQLLTDTLPQIGDVIGTALEAIASALAQPEVSEGVKSMINGIQTAVSALAPAMEPVGLAFGALLQVIGAFAGTVGPLLAAALTPLATAFAALAPQLIPIIQLLGGTLTTAFTALAPVIAQLVPVVGTLLGGAFGLLGALLPPIAQLFGTLVAAVAPLVTTLVSGLAPVLPILGAALGTVATALGPLVTMLGSILGAVLGPVVEVLGNVLAAILPKLGEALSNLVAQLMPLLSAFQALVNFLMPVLAPVLEWLAEFILGALVGAINGIAQVIEGVIGVFQGLWQIISNFGSDWGAVWDGVWQVFNGIWNMIAGVFRTVLNIGILKVAGTALKALGNLFKAGWNAIKAAFTAAWNGIKNNFDNWLRALVLAPRTMMNQLRSLFTAAWNAIRTATTAAWNAVTSAVSKGVTGVINFVKTLPGKIMALHARFAGALIGAGKAVIEGLINGIRSMLGKLEGVLDWITDKLPDWKGPMSKDKVLLYATGKAIMKGLIKGLESQFSNVEKKLKELTDLIPKVANKNLRQSLKGDAKDLAALLKHWEKYNERLKEAKENLKALREEAREYAKSIRDEIISAADVTDLEEITFAGMIEKLAEARDQARKFSAVLAQLQRLGLNEVTFDQLVQKGGEEGLKAAEEILNAGQAGVDQINKLQEELGQAAGQVGKTAASVMYDNGIRMAEGLVKGLQQYADKIEAQMVKIAEAMVEAIRKALGIKTKKSKFVVATAEISDDFVSGMDKQKTKMANALPVKEMVNGGKLMSKGILVGIESGYDSIRKSLTAFSKELGKTELQVPAVKQVTGATTGSNSKTAAVSSRLASAATPARGDGNTNVLNYYAAPNKSLSAEEELFRAAGRARMKGW